MVKVTCYDCRKSRFDREYPAHKCSIHDRCLPTYRPGIGALTEWESRKPESDIYKLCFQCPSFEAAQPAQ